jgi:TRAP-type C4-dicarboxylate transport system permease small subunit
MRVIQILSNVIGKILEVMIVFFLVLMTILMFAQVLGRFLFKNGLFWAEELSRFTMITMVYLGAGLACKNKDHISVTILEEYIKGRLHKIYRVAVSLVSIIFLIVIVKYGFSVLSVVSSQKSANMQVTMDLIYMIIPIGACIMIFYIIVEIIQILFTKKEGEKVQSNADAGGKEK